MKKSLLRRFPLFIAACLALWAAALSSGCRTMEGAGKDIERLGEKIQDKAAR